MPNSGRDIDIFEYFQYVMGTFEFHKLLNMNLVLPVSDCNHGNNQWLELFHLVIILQNLMCIKIVEYKILEQALDKSI